LVKECHWHVLVSDLLLDRRMCVVKHKYQKMRSASIVYSFLNINSSGRPTETPAEARTKLLYNRRRKWRAKGKCGKWQTQDTDCGRAIIIKSTFVARPSIKRLGHGDLKEVLFYYWNDPCSNQRRIAASKKKIVGAVVDAGRQMKDALEVEAKRWLTANAPFLSTLQIDWASPPVPLPTPVGSRNVSCVQDKNKTQNKVDRSIRLWLVGVFCFSAGQGSCVTRMMALCIAPGDHCVQVSRTTFSRCVGVAKRTLTRV